MSACMVAECVTPALARGLCNAHYKRQRRTGGTDLQPVLAVRDRLLTGRTVTADGCWLWAGAPGKNGYGRISVENTVRYAHRVSYETFVGPIPQGLTIDHLCRVRMCINPGHLEPVTLAENTRRENAVRDYTKGMAS